MAVNAVKFLGTSTDDQALALKMYSGVFTEAFRSSTFLWNDNNPCIARKTVQSGKSWQFLMMGDLDAPEDFNPGDEVAGQNMAIEEGVVTVDKYLVAHNYIPRDQMKYAHFDILPRLAKAQARRIGRAYDARLFALAVLAARSSANVNVTKNGMLIHGGGNQVIRTGGTLAAAVPGGAYAVTAAGAAAFKVDVRSLARLQDEDNVPMEGRQIWTRPDIKEILLNDTTPSATNFFSDLFDKDIQDGSNERTNRRIARLEGYQVMGFPNTVSNRGPLPSTNVATGLAKYQGNFSVGANGSGAGLPVAVALAPGEDGGAAIGVVTFETVQNVVVYKPERLSWLVMSFVLCGGSIMNPWLAGSVEVTV